MLTPCRKRARVLRPGSPPASPAHGRNRTTRSVTHTWLILTRGSTRSQCACTFRCSGTTCTCSQRQAIAERCRGRPGPFDPDRARLQSPAGAQGSAVCRGRGRRRDARDLARCRRDDRTKRGREHHRSTLRGVRARNSSTRLGPTRPDGFASNACALAFVGGVPPRSRSRPAEVGGDAGMQVRARRAEDLAAALA